MLRFDWWHWKLAVLIGLSASAVGAADLSDIQTHMPGVLQDNFGKGTTDYSSYAPRIKFPITDYPSTLNSQVRNKGGSNLGGDQCDQTNFTPVWWDTLCETRKSKDSPPLGCPLTTVHQGVDIRGGTPATCKALRTARQNLVPVVAVEDGTIRYIGDYAVDLWPRSGVRYRYLHMNMKGLKVQLNQKVTAGQIIGYMYNDFGGTSTTFHLHFEHWMNISGVGFRPVPVYCDLISAYEKDKGVKSSMLGGGQKCEASTSSDGQEQPAQPAAPDVVENAKVSSYWQYGSSEVGLIAEGASRRFLYTKPDLNVPHPARAGDMIFDGRKEGENYVGKARLPGDTCGDDTFEVNGPIANEGKTVNLTGSRNRHGAECSTSGITQENLRLDFVRRISDSGATTTTCGPSPDRQFKTEITRNWGAITMYVPFDNWLSYIKMWPGLKVDGNGQPVDVQIDKLGGSIMAFETDESGVGIWWYWLLVRKGYGSDGIPVRNPTFVQLARGIAGDDASAQALNNYIDNYTALSPLYFGRQIGRDEQIVLTDKDQLWALAQTMFHHESSRTPLIDRATFERGIAFGTDFMSGQFKGKTAYVLACDGSHPKADEPVVGSGDLDQRLKMMEETNARLTAMVGELQKRLQAIGKLASE